MVNKTLVNVPISIGNYDEFISNIINLASNSVSSYVCTMNVHMLVEAYLRKSFTSVIENADIVTPDGKPITWALNLLKHVYQTRISGMDILPSLLKISEYKNLSVYFYGGTIQLLKETQKHLKSNFPCLNVAGFYSPPFRQLLWKEEQEIIERINDSQARIVFVVLGCPKQEEWMAAMKGKIKAVMIGIGGALPVMVGMQKRAPSWMQNMGMEWLYRLHLEPRRLFKRYAVTNSIFIFIVCKEIVKKFLSPSSSFSSE